MKRSFADIMAGLDSERAQKVARKLPAWAAVDGIEIPSALSLEQCSSYATALYKQALIASRGGSSPLQNFALRAHPSQPDGWAPPVHEATGGHGFAGATSHDVPQTGTDGCAANPLASEDRSVDQSSHAKLNAGAVAVDVPLRTVLDLTGGLGVDSWAFAQVAERVVYFERNEELAAAAGRNFQRLGAGNIDVRCETVTPQTELPEANLIYADPARRDAAGRKVFLLEDCTPDILTLLPMLLRKAPAVLVKLSPMADLAMLAERLGPELREIHVVECDGEVKELLCLLLRDNSTPEPDIIVARLIASRGGSGHGFAGATSPDVPQKEGDVRFVFKVSEERSTEAVYAAGVQPGDVLLEPCPALLKAGAFRLPCTRWGLRKLAPSTHLYLAPAAPGTKTGHFAPGSLKFDVPGINTGQNVPGDQSTNQVIDLPGAKTPQFAPGNEKFASPGAETGLFAPGNCYFKAWRVCDTLPFGAAAFKALKQRYPRADVTARNLPLGSAELQKRLGVTSGGDVHIFGCRLADGSSVLLVTESAQ